MHYFLSWKMLILTNFCILFGVKVCTSLLWKSTNEKNKFYNRKIRKFQSFWIKEWFKGTAVNLTCLFVNEWSHEIIVNILRFQGSLFKILRFLKITVLKISLISTMQNVDSEFRYKIFTIGVSLFRWISSFRVKL